jgi:uncharacterized damage-inducible protein DinB
MIDGLSEEQIRRQVIAGKWSIFENIVHLQTYQHIFILRVREILEKDNPQFIRYTAEADPEFLDYCEKPLREVMQDMITVRKQMATEMIRFEEADYTRKGTHPFFGEMTLLQWINFFLLHEAHHLFAIFKLAAQLRNTNTPV